MVYEGGGHTFEDVAEAVEKGEAQFWPGPHSVIITQLDAQPRRTLLQFFLAAGNAAELQVMEPEVLRWGKEQGCTVARLVGRKGWTRTWVMDQGWENTNLVVLEKAI